VLANAGHFDVEISLDDLRAFADGPPTAVLPLVEAYRTAGGRTLNLLARGSGGQPRRRPGAPRPAVMDVSFALQALSAELLVREQLTPGVHEVPPVIDEEVARLKLASLGVEIDTETPGQLAYRGRWRPAVAPPAP
jgi:adenosylhomocysteinase